MLADICFDWFYRDIKSKQWTRTKVKIIFYIFKKDGRQTNVQTQFPIDRRTRISTLNVTATSLKAIEKFTAEFCFLSLEKFRPHFALMCKRYFDLFSVEILKHVRIIMSNIKKASRKTIGCLPYKFFDIKASIKIANNMTICRKIAFSFKYYICYIISCHLK